MRSSSLTRSRRRPTPHLRSISRAVASRPSSTALITVSAGASASRLRSTMPRAGGRDVSRAMALLPKGGGRRRVDAAALPLGSPHGPHVHTQGFRGFQELCGRSSTPHVHIGRFPCVDGCGRPSTLGSAWSWFLREFRVLSGEIGGRGWQLEPLQGDRFALRIAGEAAGEAAADDADATPAGLEDRPAKGAGGALVALGVGLAIASKRV